MLDCGRQQLHLGGIVMKLGAPGYAGPLRDGRGRRRAVAELDEALDGGVEQSAPGLGAPLLLRTSWPRLYDRPLSHPLRSHGHSFVAETYMLACLQVIAPIGVGGPLTARYRTG